MIKLDVFYDFCIFKVTLGWHIYLKKKNGLVKVYFNINVRDIDKNKECLEV